MSNQEILAACYTSAYPELKAVMLLEGLNCDWRTFSSIRRAMLPYLSNKGTLCGTMYTYLTKSLLPAGLVETQGEDDGRIWRKTELGTLYGTPAARIALNFSSRQNFPCLEEVLGSQSAPNNGQSFMTTHRVLERLSSGEASGSELNEAANMRAYRIVWRLAECGLVATHRKWKELYVKLTASGEEVWNGLCSPFKDLANGEIVYAPIPKSYSGSIAKWQQGKKRSRAKA